MGVQVSPGAPVQMPRANEPTYILDDDSMSMLYNQLRSAELPSIGRSVSWTSFHSSPPLVDSHRPSPLTASISLPLSAETACGNRPTVDYCGRMSSSRTVRCWAAPPTSAGCTACSLSRHQECTSVHWLGASGPVHQVIPGHPSTKDCPGSASTTDASRRWQRMGRDACLSARRAVVSLYCCLL